MPTPRLTLATLAELLDYVSVSAGMAVAASSYMVLGLLVRAHSLAELVLVMGAACAMCLLLALALGEMSSRFPSAPGIRTYVRRAFGERISLFFTYVLMFIIPLVAGVEIKVFLAALLPDASVALQCLVAALLVLLLAWLNLSGHDLPRTAQTLVFCLLVLVSLYFSALGLSGAPSASALPQLAAASASASAATSPGSTLAAIGEGIGLAFFLFVGFEWVAPMARSPKAAKGVVPWSMVWAVALLGLMYLAFGLALKLSLPAALLASSSVPHVTLGEHLLGGPGRWLAQALSLFALLTTLNAGLMGATRLVYGLARERALGPQCSAWLAHLSEQGVPSRVVQVLASASLLVALWVIAGDHATAVASAGAGLYTLIYGVFAASHVRLRQQGAARPDFHTRVPNWVYHLLALLALAVATATLLAAVQDSALALLALLAFALVAALMAHHVAKGRSTSTASTPFNPTAATTATAHTPHPRHAPAPSPTRADNLP